MKAYIFEDRAVSNLQPLTLTRPAFELRCGALTLLERQLHCLVGMSPSLLVRPALKDLCKLNYPSLQVNPDWLEEDESGHALFINARWLALTTEVASIRSCVLGMIGDKLAFALLPLRKLQSQDTFEIAEWIESQKGAWPTVDAGGSLIEYPWDLLQQNGAAIEADFEFRRASCCSRNARKGLAVRGSDEHVLIDPSASVEPFVTMDSTEGSIIIDRRASVRSFSRIQGPCYIGSGTQVLGASISGSSIGPTCRIGGEVEASIIQGFTNKAHGGFLGHSCVGEWVNVGAGADVSDLRNDYGNIRITMQDRQIDTGTNKVGAFIGDHTKIGIHTSINSGSVIGPFCDLFTSGCLLPRSIPPFHRFGLGRLRRRTDLEQLLTTAQRVMQRRGKEWTAEHASFFTMLYSQNEQARQASHYPTANPAAFA